jgi:hypothetical protein
MNCGHYCTRWFHRCLWSEMFLTTWVIFSTFIMLWVFINSHKHTPVNCVYNSWSAIIHCTSCNSWWVTETNSRHFHVCYSQLSSSVCCDMWGFWKPALSTGECKLKTVFSIKVNLVGTVFIIVFCIFSVILTFYSEFQVVITLTI